MNSYNDINQKLEILYDLLVDNFGVLKTELISLIATPEKISDTNKFAALISDLNRPAFLAPLLNKISEAEKTDLWLSDFLYAAINLLDELSSDEEIEIPGNLIDKLGVWTMESKGELAWKAAGLLKYSYSAAAEKIQLKKLEQAGDFFLTYVECILGLFWYDESKYLELVRQIANDESRDEKLREYCADLIKSRQ